MPWFSYITVQKENAFDWRTVWENQASDVHPPFYYLILHIICSLFPGKFSKWFAGSINIVFAVLTLFIVRKLVYELMNNQSIVSIVSIFFISSGGILYSVLFLRMYVMTMFLVSLCTWLFVYAIRFEKLSWHFYGTLILISYVGALTHYYFIVYLFFLCLVFGIWLLIHKRYSETVLFAFSMGLSGGLAVITFPFMLYHMFLGGYRGEQSIENLKSSVLVYLERLESFYQAVDQRLFGGILIYAILVIICVFIFSKFTENRTEISEGNILTVPDNIRKNMIKWMLMVIPSICYFLLVSKIAVLITERYLRPAYAVFMVWIVCGIFSFGKRIVERRYWFIAAGLFLSILTVNSWKACSGSMMFKDSEELVSKAKKHASCNCLYIYDAEWRVLPSYVEVSQYKSVTFYQENNVQSIDEIEYLSDKEMVVCITNPCDSQAILEYIMDVCPSLNAYQEMGSFKYATSYYLYEDEAGNS